MRVKEVIKALENVDPEKVVAVQKNYQDGGFSLHGFAIQVEGHIGYRGPVIHLMAPFVDPSETNKDQEKKP